MTDRTLLLIQIAEVTRLIAEMRKHYPSWIADGRLEEMVANHRITTLEGVLRTLRSLDQGEMAL